MTHFDLFAGIGGFSLALDNIYGKQNTNHIFIEWDDFCTEVLKKHWPEAEYHKDIRKFIADTKRKGHERNEYQAGQDTRCNRGQVFLTGGFPCQPFSQAGRRRGTEDDRYLWPEMLECIRLFRPDWVVAENVAGLVTWNEGMVLEQVCSDLENEGYEVQPFIIPAVSVNAPHRRDRIWIIACHPDSQRLSGKEKINSAEAGEQAQRQSKGRYSDAANTRRERQEKQQKQTIRDKQHSWNKNWVEVATELCRVDDGIPKRLDRNPRLKALGNAIVPQVAEKIFEAIKSVL